MIQGPQKIQPSNELRTCRSKRPGRLSAGSNVSARLVAAITMTPSLDSKPSCTGTRLTIFYTMSLKFGQTSSGHHYETRKGVITPLLDSKPSCTGTCARVVHTMHWRVRVWYGSHHTDTFIGLHAILSLNQHTLFFRISD